MGNLNDIFEKINYVVVNSKEILNEDYEIEALNELKETMNELGLISHSKDYYNLNSRENIIRFLMENIMDPLVNKLEEICRISDNIKDYDEYKKMDHYYQGFNRIYNSICNLCNAVDKGRRLNYMDRKIMVLLKEIDLYKYIKYFMGARLIQENNNNQTRLHFLLINKVEKTVFEQIIERLEIKYKREFLITYEFMQV